MRKAWFLLLPLLALSSCVPEGASSSSSREGLSSSSSEEVEGGYWVEGPRSIDIGERGRYELMGEVPEGEIRWEVNGEEGIVEEYAYPNPLFYGLTGLEEGEIRLEALLGEKVLLSYEVEVKDVDSGFHVETGGGKVPLGGKMLLRFFLDGEELPAKESSHIDITTLSSPSVRRLVLSHEEEGIYVLGEELGSFRSVASWNGLLSNPFEIEVVPPVEGKRYRMEALLEDGSPAKDSTIPTSSTVTFVLRDEEGEDYPFQWGVEMLEGDSTVLQETEDPHVFETYYWNEERILLAPVFPGEAPELVEETLELYVMEEGKTPLLDFHLEDEEGNEVETLFVLPDGSTRFSLVPERESDYVDFPNVYSADDPLNPEAVWTEGEGYSLAFNPEKGGSFSLFIGFTFAKKEFPVHVMPAEAELTLEVIGMEVYPSGEMLYTAGESGQISNSSLGDSPIYCDFLDYDIEYVFLEGEDLVRIEGGEIAFLAPGKVSLYAHLRGMEMISNTFSFEITPAE